MRSRETPQKDELIRQVTINCAERGLLLLRVRDEIHMTIAAYQTMYESSIAFGIRKALIAEQRKAEMEAKVKTENICTTVSLGVVHGAFDEFLFLLLFCCFSGASLLSHIFYLGPAARVTRVVAKLRWKKNILYHTVAWRERFFGACPPLDYVFNKAAGLTDCLS